MIEFPLVLVIEPKDGATASGQRPELPSLAELIEHLGPLLVKGTERHALLGYQVTEVTAQ